MPGSGRGILPTEWLVSPPSPTTPWSDVQAVTELLAAALLAASGVETGDMPDTRTSTALRQLSDLGREPEPSRWSWAVRNYEPGGRIRLPVGARTAIGHRRGERLVVHGLCQRVGLVIVADDDDGARLVIDPEGRLMLPAWLRRGAERSLLIGSDSDASTVLIAPVNVLDAVGELLIGRSR